MLADNTPSLKFATRISGFFPASVQIIAHPTEAIVFALAGTPISRQTLNAVIGIAAIEHLGLDYIESTGDKLKIVFSEKSYIPVSDY